MRKKFLTEKEFQLLKDTLNNNEYENKDKSINKQTPLEALERIYCHLPRIDGDRFKRDKDIIETALKDYEMVKDCVCIAASIGLDGCRKRDKALEIIKKKGLTLEEIITIKTTECWKSFEKITKQRNKILPKTREEYDLLKEELL